MNGLCTSHEKKSDTKEDNGKSMMHILFIHCGISKATNQAEGTANSIKSRPGF